MRRLCSILFAIGLSLLFHITAHGQDVRTVPDPSAAYEQQMLQLADGYEINLFASEPMIAKPVRMVWDERGRLWIVGTTSYPQIVPGQTANDRIVVLEDTDKDGRADKSTVFADGLHMPTGLALGDGGVYVGNSTELLHLRDTDGDLRADERRVVFNGFGQDDTHHLINTFRWGPGGRLYINQGIYTFSNIETPWGPRRLHGAGIWRLDPGKLRLEVYMRGTVNPWGHEFDEWGQSFVTDGAGSQGIYYVYPETQFQAAVGAARTIDGLNDAQPKYAGLEILSGRHLPDSLQGHLLTNDYRANRVNRLIVTEQQSGYASTEAGPLVWTQHVAFRPVDIRMGPDGAIYLADWYNPIIQHGEIDFRDPRRDHKHGRIWRITAKDRPLVDPPDLTDATEIELLEALKLPETWTRRQARRLLKERGARTVAPALATWVESLDPANEAYERLLMEALFVTQSVDVVDRTLLDRVLEAEDPRARAAAVRVVYHWHDQLDGVDAILKAAVEDQHPRVRREAVTALHRRGSADAAKTALTVLERSMDRFLDYALWKTLRELEPYWLDEIRRSPDYFGTNEKLAFALKTSTDPYSVARLTRMYDAGEVPAAYRQDVLDAVADYGSPEDLQIIFDHALAGKGDVQKILAALEEAAQQSGARANDPELRSHDVDKGAERAGGRPVEGLSRVESLMNHEDDIIAASAARLAGYWKLTDLREKLVQMAESDGSSEDLREASVEALASMDDPSSTEALVQMTQPDRPLELRLFAASALPSIDLELASETAVDLFKDMPADADPSPVFQSLFAHPEGPRVLAAALEGEEFPAGVAQAGLEVIRARGWRWHASNEFAPTVQTALERIGGPLPPPRIPQNPSPEQIDRLELDIKAEGDAARGELVYRRSELACMTCHAIGGAGGKAGPDLGSLGASAPTDYIIEAVLLPDKAVKDGYSLVHVTKSDGSVVTGMRVRESGDEIILRNQADEEVTIPMNHVEERAIVPGSLMPPGLTARLEEDEFKDLIKFMSELGETEEFIPESGWIRRWRTLAATENVLTTLKEEGAAGLLGEDSDRLPWQPRYSLVAGNLPLEDLPIIEDEDGRRRSFVRFEIDVRDAGEVELAINHTDDLAMWLGPQEIDPVQDTVTLRLAEGIHRITVAVDRAGSEADLAVRLLETSSAQVRPVIGK